MGICCIIECAHHKYTLVQYVRVRLWATNQELHERGKPAHVAWFMLVCESAVVLYYVLQHTVSNEQIEINSSRPWYTHARN